MANLITRKKKDAYNSSYRYLVIGIIVLALFVIFSFISKGFFSINTFMNLLRQSSALALVAIGMTFIILTGGIDLSVGSCIALSGTVAALAMQRLGGQGLFVAIVGILVTFMVCCFVGVVNGVMIGFLNVSAFIVTLATMSLCYGLTLTISSSSRVLVQNSYYNMIGQADLFGRIPIAILLVVASYIIASIIMSKTVFGRNTYAIGDNPVTSFASGINVVLHTIKVYAFASIFVALATIVVVGRARSAQPLAGTGLEFDVITAVVLGGTSLLGGQGSLKGTAIGAALLAVITTGMGMLDISPFVSYIVKGVLILIAVLSNIFAIKQASKVVKEEVIHVENKNIQKVLTSITSGEQRVLSLKNISKTFPGVKALHDVSLDIKRGTVHALCGENGAGKSTLMKVLSGVYSKDSGEILVDGIPVSIKSPMDSQKLGISVIYQELAMVPELNVYQNVFLGKEIKYKGGIFLNSKKMAKATKELLNRFNLNININRRISDYTVSQQQMVEIAKAVGSNSWVIVMDEPTSAISEADKENLFKIIRELKKQDIAVVYISHRMSEILEIADAVTVLRDGQNVVTADVKDVDENMLIKYMVGREVKEVFSREKVKPQRVVLEVKNLFRKGAFDPISFVVREGEVLGFSGLVGAGRTEIMRCIFGLDRYDGGEIYLDGKKLDIKTPQDAINAGIALISEDRRKEGILPHMTVRENITIASLPVISKMNWIDAKKDSDISSDTINSLAIRTPSPEQQIANLSGGNQQKVCVGKWLARKPRLIIMDEPTRGIDVGAKAEIHKIIEKLAKENIAIILISSEMLEIMGAADRLMVLYEGRLTGEYIVDEYLTQETIMKSAAGVENREDMAVSQGSI